MKVTHLIKALLLLFIFSSCKKEKVVTEDKPVKTDSVTAPAPAYTTQSIIKQLIDSKKQVQAKLPLLSHDEANALYEKFKQENDTLLSKIQGTESQIAENYYTYFSSEDDKPMVMPDSISKKIKLLATAQLELWPIGEGYVDIRLAPDYYNSIFKSYVSDDYKLFLEITAKEDEVLYSADAGLGISFNDLGKRVITWENFISKNPYSKLFSRALENYRGYQYDYLLGMDNTPTIAFETNTFYPENIAEFKQFIAKHPNSKTVPLINAALAFKGSKDEMYSFVENTQRQLIDKIEADASPDYQ